MDIRRLTVDDVEALREIRLEALKAHPENFGAEHDDEAAWPIEAWRKRLANARGAGFGAFDGETLAGIISFGREAAQKHAHQGSIGSFYVRPAYRGKGVGDALMAAALAEAARTVEQVTLTVTATNAGAIRLYERHGFAVVGTLPRSIRVNGVDHDELSMWRRV